MLGELSSPVGITVGHFRMRTVVLMTQPGLSSHCPFQGHPTWLQGLSCPGRHPVSLYSQPSPPPPVLPNSPAHDPSRDVSLYLAAQPPHPPESAHEICRCLSPNPGRQCKVLWDRVPPLHSQRTPWTLVPHDALWVPDALPHGDVTTSPCSYFDL